MDQPKRIHLHPTLLLIDDCVSQRDLYEVALQLEFNIVTATRGSDGLALAAAEHPDAIVLDVMMPGMDGWETCTRIKSDAATADIPVILLTCANDVDLSEHAIAVGASAIFTKPCHADRLKMQFFHCSRRHRVGHAALA